MLNLLKVPETYQASEIKAWNNSKELADGRWVPVRPFCFRGWAIPYRLKMAAKVFFGKADVLEWEGKRK